LVENDGIWRRGGAGSRLSHFDRVKENDMSILDFLKDKSDPRDRLEAVAAQTDQQELAKVAMSDDSPRVRKAALERITDEHLLAEVAKDAVEMDVRLAAVERIDNQELLAAIIRERKNFRLMGACFGRISDRKVLEAIAQDTAYNPAARRMAVEQFADESYLTDFDGDEPEQPEYTKKDERAVQTILNSFGGIKVVRALGRFRGSDRALKALGSIARKGGEEGGLAVEYLVRALKSTNPKTRACASEELSGLSRPELVDVLIRSLDDTILWEPVRDILKQIDTPEARAALADSGDEKAD
jgi:hypothetical protein